MASEQIPKLASARTPGGRTTPVLVPQGALAGQPDVPLDRPVTTVGSNDNARLHLVSRTVSNGHAIFVNSGGVTYVADLTSRTGVLVNGRLIKDVDLKTGDRIQIGKFVFRYRSPAGTAPPPPAIMPPAAAVIVVGSPAKPIEGRVFQIGRKENSDVSLPADAAVSAGHAVIFEMDGRWHLRDLGSRTGTLVNGKAIHQHLLNFGDRIVIGSSTILFQPSAARVESVEPEVEPELDALSETAELPLALERDEEETQPLLQAASAEDAIPLEDDLPTHSLDWKSAFPVSASEEEMPAVEPEPIPVEETVEPVVERPATIEPVADVEPEPIAIEPEPVPVEETVEPVTEISTTIEPVPVFESEPIAIEPAPIPIEETVEPVVKRPAAEPLGSVLARESEVKPLVAQVAEIVQPIEDFVFVPVNEKADPNALPEVIFWGDSELDSAAEQAVSRPPADVQPAPENSESPTGRAASSARELAAETASPVEPEKIVTPEPDIQTPTELVEDSQVEQEISLLEHGPDSATHPPVDPLADSFPLVQAVEDVAVPQDLHALSAAAVATAGIYESNLPAPVPTAVDHAAITAPVAEEFGSEPESQPIERFIEAESTSEMVPDLQAPATSTEVATAGDETFELADLDFVDAETDAVTQTPTPTEFSGHSTVDEIPAWDEIKDANEFEGIEATHLETIPDEPPASVESLADLPVVEEPLTPSEAVSPTINLPESNESDLEFLDVDVESTDIAQQAPPAAEPVKPADSGAAADRPSIFGFQFEGGSFLGGLPISLKGPAPDAPPTAPTAVPASPSPVFDASRKPPVGLDRKAASTPSTPRISTDAAQVRPNTPPRPAIRQQSAPSQPTSLSGIAAAPRVTEVFSQMSAPIGVDVFGGRSGDPNQFTVPDSEKMVPNQPETPPALQPQPVVALPPLNNTRRSRLPLLLILAVLVPAGLLGAIYKYVPVSSPVTGSISFDGLLSQQAVDGHTFRVNQAALLAGGDVREMAQAILEQKGLPPGFTSDQDTYGEIVTSQSLNWDQQKTLQFTYNTTNEPLGREQVNAVMTALAQKDIQLEEDKAQAKIEAERAKHEVDLAGAKVEELKLKRRAQLEKAQECPDTLVVAQADQDAQRLKQAWMDARTMRQNSEKVLADLRSEDPNKPIDIESDEQVKDLKNRLQPLLDQIAKLKGTNGIEAGSKTVIGTDVPIGATTQPDLAANPLIGVIQKQADQLSQKLEERRAELSADAAIDPAQRAVNLSREIEDFSVKIHSLDQVEDAAKKEFDTANAASLQNHSKVDAARLAAVEAEALQVQQAQAEVDRQAAVKLESDKEAALARCITMSGKPEISVGEVTDLRMKLSIGSMTVALLFFGTMIVGEIRRPKLITGIAATAAPLANPPTRLVPWPQPREIGGLNADLNQESLPVGEPEQVFGV